MSKRVYTYRPYIPEKAIEYVKDVLESGCLAGTCYRYVKNFEQLLAKYLNIKHVIACSSGTTALQVCLRSIGICERCFVIVPGFTFIATASTVLHNNAIPIFADIELETLGIDIEDVENILRKYKNLNIKALVAVHIGGIPVKIRELLKICEEYNIKLVEDCAQALGAEYDGRKVGTFGIVSAFSFYPTKTITTGEGGAIATNDDNIEKIARLIINHGEDRKYHYVELGYNYRMSEINAAIGISQLENIEYYVETRRKFAEIFIKEVEKYVDDNLLRFQKYDKNSKPCWNLIQIIINFEKIRKSRDWFLNELHNEGLKLFTVAYPEPLNRAPLFRKYFEYSNDLYRELGFRDLKNCEYVCKNIITMLVPPGLTEDDAYEISERFLKVLKKAYSNL